MSRLSSRKKLGALVGVVVLIGTGGWIAGTQVRSPADAAAAHTAPKAGLVTVAVQRQSLTATVVASGSVEFASPRPLALAGAVGTGASAGAAGEGAEQRITKAPVAGTKVKEGDVLMTVNGRPVLALSGSVPMYRALAPGASGDDVKQLQRALRRLGFDPGSISGNYRQGTASAVTNWYTSKGYEAQKPSMEDQQQLGQLEQAVSSAQQSLLTTNSTSGSGDGGTETGTGTDTETGTGTEAGAGANSGASTPNPQSSTDAQIHQLQLESARKSLDMANDALSTFQASYGTKVPAGEVVFFPKLPVRLNKVTVKTGDTASGPIGTVTSSDLEVQAVVPGADAELLRKGMAVELTTTDGKKAKGTVSALGADAAASSTTETTGSGEDGEGSAGTTTEGTETDVAAGDTGTSDAGSSAPVQLRISVADPGELADEAEAAVKVTIKIGASDGKVLVVPLAAIRTSSDGKVRVQVERAGKLSDIPVTVGLSSAGLVEVKPTSGTLNQGDKVVVGE
ncbi:peptidoglycan-binding protein [Streptomyces sp. WI04-05B]|uniref:peptidoglycan-binding protein n=1 Tax=Streptomyces TaxID=1883 RepID=UPI0029B02C58|nr:MULTISPECIES: peptidoglycan-binding protein [unclassified Streptomyces]MDX2546345.1 peptidoglycan-binding protein [Streptomyces sp. WI04-05B]MDX2589202.1 peptidoglycan-binding protein [Streptomyces sp. WI04-05A]